MLLAGIKVLYVTLFNGLQSFIFNDLFDRDKEIFSWNLYNFNYKLWYEIDIIYIRLV